MSNAMAKDDNSKMNEIMQALQLSAMTSQRVSEQMGIVVDKVNILEGKVIGLEQDFQTFKDNEKINRSQGKNISRAVRGRVNTILKIRFDGGRVADDSIETDQKYRGGFIARCYTDAKSAGVMAECYWETPKRDYDRCLEYIEAWVPQVDGGTAKYKEYLDIRREEREAGRR